MNKDLLIVVGTVLLAVAACTVFNLGFIAGTILMYAIPAVYLSWRKPKIIAKSLVFTLIATVPLAIIVNYLAQRDFSWYTPNSVFRFLGDQPIEDVIWGAAWVYLIIVFWESFAEKEKIKNVISWNIKYLLGLMVFLQVIFWSLYIWANQVLYLPYLYLVWGVTFCVFPVAAILYFNKRLISKVATVGIFFLFHSLAMEFIGLTLGFWYFSGAHYIGVVNFFEHRLPYEEIVFWIILGAPAAIAWYELFTDDRK